MADPTYFTVAEFRLLPDMSDAATYTEAKVLAAAAFFTEIVEREIGRTFVRRTFVETLDGSGESALLLSHLPVYSLTTVTVGGTTVATNLLGFTGGVLRYLTATTNYAVGTAWTAGIGNVVVTYTAGEGTAAPADIKDAVMWATRDRLISQASQNGVDVRKTSMSNDFGTVSYILPGEKRPTGYPELDALIASYVRTSPSLGFA